MQPKLGQIWCRQNKIAKIDQDNAAAHAVHAIHAAVHAAFY
jgi:hypothetical protein